METIQAPAKRDFAQAAGTAVGEPGWRDIMETAYTHYSLFDGYATVADFTPLTNGLPALLADLHRQTAKEPNYCVSVGPDANGHFGALHPGADQISLKIGRRFTLVLYTPRGVAVQAAELASEGNESAKLARAAMA